MENQPLTQFEEQQILKAGYHLLMREHAPIGESAEQCHSPENAYFFNLEKENLKVPESLHINRLLADIPTELHPQLKEIWENLQDVTQKYAEYLIALRETWENTPDVTNEKTEALLATTPYKMTAETKKTVLTLLEKSSSSRTVLSWQVSERGIRELIYKQSKKLITSLRLYYEFLLYHKDEQYVLPQNHPERQKIADKNNYLRLIQIKHAATSIAKTGHHHQSHGKIRKNARLPYVLHTEDVSNMAIMDVIPFTLEGKISFDFILLSIVTSLHDLEEDTDLTLEDIVNNYLNRADSYDGSIDPFIKLPFNEDNPNSRQEFKDKALNLIKKTTITNFKRVMRILSSTTQWTNQEKIAALKSSIGGKDLTVKLLTITPEEEKQWQNAKPVQEKKLPFVMFPEEYDNSKMTKFLLRLNSMTTSNKVRQMSLIVKAEDRAHNIATSDGFSPEKKKELFRETTTRLIAWCMTEHNLTEYPLYNALPRLIYTTIEKYEKLKREHPTVITEKDEQLINQLNLWYGEILINNLLRELPERIQQTIDQWKSAHPLTP
ncbi:hypothetical protein COU74_00795 [Candidatus Peregrinibacteria bacterium CG10_big_fil_rev_8_21_14_0_10_36_19]|nr:MAG: hypothetical protein COU74_00795 [Candidatus Peregrinibacteria bacterium CG10_big_fil_rev_8_21_14_0_10_36_19]